MEESNTIKNQSEDIKDLAMALCKAQSEMIFAIKSSENPFYKSKYADLSSVWDVCRSPLTKNGLCVVQQVDGLSQNGEIILNTILMHSSGQWVKSVILMKLIDNKPQTYGSTLTYARRYGLSSLVGVIQDDDDGNQASGIGFGNRYKCDSSQLRGNTRNGGGEKNEVSDDKKSEYLEKMRNTKTLEELKSVWDKIPFEYTHLLTHEKNILKDGLSKISLENKNNK